MDAFWQVFFIQSNLQYMYSLRFELMTLPMFCLRKNIIHIDELKHYDRSQVKWLSLIISKQGHILRS